MEAIVDGQTGDLLSQRQIEFFNDYTPSNSTTEWNHLPNNCRQQRHGHYWEDTYGRPLMPWYPSTAGAPEL